MNIAEIVPVARFPRGLEIFDYALPDSLVPTVGEGDYVLIPFRGQTLTGVVWKLKEGSAERLKTILQVCGTSEIADSREREFLIWFSRYYCVSLAHALTLVSTKLSSKEIVAKEKTSLTCTPDTPLFLEQYSSPDKPLVSLGLSLNEKQELFRYLAYDVLKKEKQALFLLPTIHEAENLHQDLFSLFGNATCLLTGDLGVARERNVKAGLKEQSHAIAVGTRSALFAHLPSLDLIVLDNAERQEYKQYDLNPRYDARDVARKRSELFGARLLFASSAPRLEEMKACESGAMKLIDHSKPCEYTRISLTDEWKGGRHGWVSERLENALRLSLQKNKHGVLFLNRKGTSKMVTCKECEYLFACEKCISPFTYFQKEGLLKCVACYTDTPLPGRCPACGATSFRFQGLGTEKIAEEAKKLFHSYPVLEITKETLRTSELRKSLDQLKNSPEQPVLFVGTSALPIHMPELFTRVGCIGIIAADPIRNLKNFRSSEEQWQTLASLCSLAPPSVGDIYLQAFDSASQFLTDFSNNSYTTFLKRELSEREKYIWPPACELIKLMVRKRKGFDSKGLLERIKSALTSYIHESKTPLGAQVSFYSPREESGSFTLLIRISGASIQKASDCIIDKIPPGVLIDRNPFEM